MADQIDWLGEGETVSDELAIYGGISDAILASVLDKQVIAGINFVINQKLPVLPPSVQLFSEHYDKAEKLLQAMNPPLSFSTHVYKGVRLVRGRAKNPKKSSAPRSYKFPS